jgi:hypothetical protein
MTAKSLRPAFLAGIKPCDVIMHNLLRNISCRRALRPIIVSFIELASKIIGRCRAQAAARPTTQKQKYVKTKINKMAHSGFGSLQLEKNDLSKLSDVF